VAEPAAAFAPSEAPDPEPHAEPRARTRTDHPPPSSLAEELSLLTAAQHAARRARPRAALAWLDKHARRFPEGVMAEERAAERVAALCALGKTERAQRVARDFLARFAGSPQSARVQRACGEPEPAP
jgi:hypothetical protein